MKPVDVLIIGGGPAGLAAAIAAGRKGLRTTVLDCRKPPVDKTCGEGLLPAAIASLASLGVVIDARLGFPFTSIRFADEASSATAAILPGGGIGLRRRDLHRLLVERAEAEGVSLQWGARISGIETDGVWTQSAFHSSGWLVGADGQNSVVRKFARLDPRERVRPRFGFRQHFAVKPWSDAVEVHWAAGVQLIVTPTGAEEVCVVMLSRTQRVRIETARPRFPEVARRLRGAPAISREIGTTTCVSRARDVVRGSVALVGDASCTVDGISGLGLSLAFEEGRALADALAHANLAEYQRAHKRITKLPVRMTKLPVRMTKLLLTLNASPALRCSVLRILARNPGLFSRLLALHMGSAGIAHSTGYEHARNRRGAALGCGLCEPN